MIKEKRIKSIIFGFFIFLVSISNVNAASYTGFDFTAQLYDNLGPSLSSVTTSGPTAGEGSYEGYIACIIKHHHPNYHQNILALYSLS